MQFCGCRLSWRLALGSKCCHVIELLHEDYLKVQEDAPGLMGACLENPPLRYAISGRGCFYSTTLLALTQAAGESCHRVSRCKVITLHWPHASFPYQAQLSLLGRSCIMEYCPMGCSRRIERKRAALKLSVLMSNHLENRCRAPCRQLIVCNRSEVLPRRRNRTDWSWCK